MARKYRADIADCQFSDDRQMPLPYRRLIGFRLLAFVGADALAVLVAVGAAATLGIAPLALALGVGAALLALLALLGSYRLEALPGSNRVAFRLGVAACIGVGFGVAALVGTIDPATARAGAMVAGCAALLLPLASLACGSLLTLPALQELVLIVGSDPLGTAVARNLALVRTLGIRVAGHLSDEYEREPHPQLCQRLGATSDFEKVVRAFLIHRVVVSPAVRETMDLDGLLGARLAGLPIDDATLWYEALCGRVWMGAITPRLLLDGGGSDHGMPYRAAKRTTDLVFAVVGLAAALPLLLLVACAIKLDSRGPVLFHQTRLGVARRPFGLLKLRTMSQHAESDSGPALAELEDPRITRVGRLLRKSRIDEIPQLWNVLRGDMSIVGPRPERPEFADELMQDFELFRFRTAVRPGLTGWAQVHQGYVNEWHDFERKLAFDLFYLKHRSFSMEMSILRQTLVELIMLKGV